MSENLEKTCKRCLTVNVSVDDEQLNSIAEDDSLLESNGDKVSGQLSPPPERHNQKRRHDNQNRRSRQQQSQSKQSQQRITACQRNHIPSKEEFPKETLLDNVHAAPPRIAMTSLA